MIKVDKDLCIGCGACTTVCPTNSLTISEDGKCSVNNETCIQCLACISTCPVEAISEQEETKEEDTKSIVAEEIYNKWLKDCDYAQFVDIIEQLIEVYSKNNTCDYSEIVKEL